MTHLGIMALTGWVVSTAGTAGLTVVGIVSTASIVGGSAKLVKEERDKAIQEKIEARRNKLKAIDGLSISSYKDKNGKEQFKATAQSEILFKFDSYELNEEAQKMLSDLCNIITEIPNTKIKIIGHTDNIGEKQYNIKRRGQWVEYSHTKLVINHCCSKNSLKIILWLRRIRDRGRKLKTIR